MHEIVGTYGYQTSIEFAQDEKLRVVSLGDTIAWQTVPYQDRPPLKPVEPSAATTLTVLTDKRTYYFTLTSAWENLLSIRCGRMVTSPSSTRGAKDPTSSSNARLVCSRCAMALNVFAYTTMHCPTGQENG